MGSDTGSNKIKKLIAAVSFGVAILIAGMPANATFIEFFGEDLNNSPTVPLSSTPFSDASQNNFLQNLSGVGTEDFEGFPTGTSAPLDLTFPGFGGDTLSATLTGDGRIKTVSEGEAFFGRYSISGTNTWRADATGGSSFGIDFGQEIAAFGFYGIDIGDFGGQLAIDFQFNDETLRRTIPHTVGSGGSTDGSVFFYGFIGTDLEHVFESLQFDLIDGPRTDIFSFDNMTIGELAQVDPTPVPEPASILMLGFGLVGIVVYRRLLSVLQGRT